MSRFRLCSWVLASLLAIQINASDAAAATAQECASHPPADHSAADAVWAIANIFYLPFAQYPFGSDGVCVDPSFLQPLLVTYFRTDDGDSPVVEKLCLNRPAPGDLSLRWSLGPTPYAKLRVIAGEDEEEVREHDFWHVSAPDDLICSRKFDLTGMTFARDGGIDLRIDPKGGSSASILIDGITVDMGIEGSNVPSFFLSDIGIDSLNVSEQGVFSAKLDAPLFNIPVQVTGDVGPDDSMSLEVLGFDFKVK